MNRESAAIMKEQRVETFDEARVRLLSDPQVHSLVALRAYEIYQSRGAGSGHDAEDWLLAENEIVTLMMQEESRRQAEPAGNRGQESPRVAATPTESASPSASSDTAEALPETADVLNQLPGQTTSIDSQVAPQSGEERDRSSRSELTGPLSVPDTPIRETLMPSRAAVDSGPKVVTTESATLPAGISTKKSNKRRSKKGSDSNKKVRRKEGRMARDGDREVTVTPWERSSYRGFAPYSRDETGKY